MAVKDLRKMKISKIPFNITLLDPRPDRFAGLFPVQSMAIYDAATGEHHPLGLYSDVIFGKQGDDKRDKIMSFIPLKVKVFQPLYYNELITLKALYKEMLMGIGYGKWNDEVNDFERSNMLEGVTGYAAFIDKWEVLQFKVGESNKRKLRIDFLSKLKPRALTDKYLVLPAGLRDLETDEGGRPIENDVNPLYRKLLAAANTVSQSMAATNTPLLDAPRASMTRNVVAIYNHFFNILDGKQGLLRGKFARRRIFGSTRNIISSPILGSTELGDNSQVDILTTTMGVFQFVKGCEPLIVKALHSGYFADFFNDLDGSVTLVDKETLRPVSVSLKQKTRDAWGTDEGLNAIFNSFVDGDIRHNPITIDDHYLSLVYEDDNVFRYFQDIEELPKEFDRKKVRPITIGEFLYYHAEPVNHKVRWFVTRYPITGLGSINGNKSYLKTTGKSRRKYQLNSSWQKTEDVWNEYPNVVSDLPYYSSMGVHPSALPLYGGDYDKIQIAVVVKLCELLETPLS